MVVEGTGFIKNHLVKRLLSEGCNVAVLGDLGLEARRKFSESVILLPYYFKYAVTTSRPQWLEDRARYQTEALEASVDQLSDE